MTYTQVRITAEYLEKLRQLAEANKRSMLKQLEVLIDDQSGAHSALNNGSGNTTVSLPKLGEGKEK